MREGWHNGNHYTQIGEDFQEYRKWWFNAVVDSGSDKGKALCLPTPAEKQRTIDANRQQYLQEQAAWRRLRQANTA